MSLISSCAQWLALRRVARGWKWIVASIVGLNVGFGLGFGVASTSSEVTAFISIGALGGLGIGLGQWLVLRQQMSHVLWWLTANADALALGLWLAVSIASSSVDFENLGAVITLTLGCTLHSAVAGWLLPRCLKPLAR